MTMMTAAVVAVVANQDSRNASEQERNEEERERWPLVPVPVSVYTEKYFDHRNNQFKKRFIIAARTGQKGLLRHLCRLFLMTLAAINSMTTKEDKRRPLVPVPENIECRRQ